jgi:hypothetical protein
MQVAYVGGLGLAFGVNAVTQLGQPAVSLSLDSGIPCSEKQQYTCTARHTYQAVRLQTTWRDKIQYDGTKPKWRDKASMKG